MKKRIVELANHLLWKIGARISPLVEDNLLESLFYRNYHADFYFVQIGANDGVRADPIHNLVTRHRLRGLAIEPLKDMFEALQKTYKAHPQVQLENLAIHRSQQKLVLHRVRADARVSDWAHGIASINPDHHKLSGTDSAHIVTEDVYAIDLVTLFKTHFITSCDLFVVDTEGYDSEIVRMLLDSPVRPRIILFEHGLSQNIMTISEYVDLSKDLMRNGYLVSALEGDAIAYKPI